MRPTYWAAQKGMDSDALQCTVLYVGFFFFFKQSYCIAPQLAWNLDVDQAGFQPTESICLFVLSAGKNS